MKPIRGGGEWAIEEFCTEIIWNLLGKEPVFKVRPFMGREVCDEVYQGPNKVVRSHWLWKYKEGVSGSKGIRTGDNVGSGAFMGIGVCVHIVEHHPRKREGVVLRLVNPR